MRYVLLFFLPAIAFSQNQDSLTAVGHLENAVRLLEKAEPDSSLVFQKLAQTWFMKNDDLAGWLHVPSQLSKVFQYQKNDPDAAIRLLRDAFRRLPRQPGSEAEWRKLAWLHVRVAYLNYYGRGHVEEAVWYYESAKKIFEEQLDLTDPDVGEYVYRELGNLYTRLGDYAAAEVLLKKFRDISLHFKQNDLAAGACSDLSLIYIDLKDYRQAIDICLEGLSLPGVSAASKGLLQANISKAFFWQNDFEKVIRYSEMAAGTLESVAEQDEHPRAKAWLSDVYAKIGEAEGALGHFEKAEQQLQKALKTAEDFYAPDIERREVAKLRGSLGTLYLRWQKPRLALVEFHRALQLVMPAFENPDAAALPPATFFYAENTIKEALLGKAAAFEMLYRQKKNPEDLSRAVECRNLSFEVGKRLRQAYQFESSKLQIIEESQAEGEKAIELALDFPGKNGPLTAFRFAEINKSVLLFEALRSNAAGSVANVPDSLLRKLNTLDEEVAEFEKQLFKLKRAETEDSSEQVARLEGEILKKRQARKAAMAVIGEKFPAYFRLAGDGAVATVAQIQAQLRPGQVLLEYFVGDSSIFIFYLKKDAFYVEPVKKNFPLEKWVTQFRQGIEAFQFPANNRDSLCDAYTAIAQRLYQKLLGPVEKYGLPQDLLIVPGGILAFLPFDALLYEAPPASCVFKKYPYLVRRHNISYSYSATLLGELGKKRIGHSGNSFAGFAPEFPKGNGSGFDELKFNIASVEAIAPAWGGAAFVREAASAEVFRSNAGQHNILYLATHAKANTDEGDFSFVLLAKPGGGYDTLFVNDIYNLPLSADLVFLGACETGSGQWYNGEGIISLARGFLYAGAKSIVTTLWSVNDESNKNLTVSFFRHLRKGERKDEALRHAKLEQLESELPDLYAHPAFWAAYTPIGNMEPVRNPLNYWFVLAGVGFLGFVLFIFLKKRRGEKTLRVSF